MGFSVYWCSRSNGHIEYIETTAYNMEVVGAVTMLGDTFTEPPGGSRSDVTYVVTNNAVRPPGPNVFNAAGGPDPQQSAISLGLGLGLEQSQRKNPQSKQHQHSLGSSNR
jgi:hypothetical protein